MSETVEQSMNRSMQECSRNCLDTYAACTAVANHCLERGGENASRAHQTTLLDCARLCATTAEFMLRGSPLHDSVCGVCAIACRICEQYCRALSDTDPEMSECADKCERSAASCERMIAVSR